MTPKVDEVLEDVISRFLLDIPEEDALIPERLFFYLEEAHWFYNDFFSEVNPAYPPLTLVDFTEKVFQLNPCIRRSESISSMSRQFDEYKSTVPVCGGILFSEDMAKVLLVQAGKWRWTFPKGKKEKGERDAECAIREVFEETGLDASSYLTKYTVRVREEKRETTMCVFCGVPESSVLLPRTRNEISAVDWHSVANLPYIGKYDSRGHYANSVKRILRELAHSTWFAALGNVEVSAAAVRSPVPQFHFNTDEILSCLD